MIRGTKQEKKQRFDSRS